MHETHVLKLRLHAWTVDFPTKSSFRLATMRFPRSYFETTIARTNFCESTAVNATVRAGAAVQLQSKIAFLDRYSACMFETSKILQ